MTDYAEQRKQYVAEVRSSFEQTEEAKVQTTQAEPHPVAWGVRLRFVAAVCLFLFFLYGHREAVTIWGYTSGKIIDMIADNRYDTVLQEYGIIPEYEMPADQTAAKE